MENNRNEVELQELIEKYYALPLEEQQYIKQSCLAFFKKMMSYPSEWREKINLCIQYLEDVL